MQIFSLIPYSADNLPQVQITGEIERMENRLSVHYAVTGKINSILILTSSTFPSRRHDLWKATCFEFFLAVKDQPVYWEFNLSPSGDWNAYAMDAYRRIGFREETRIEAIQFKVENEAGGFGLRAEVDLNPLFGEEQILEAGITAVIQTRDRNESYWALVHPGSQADFHLRESFTVFL